MKGFLTSILIVFIATSQAQAQQTYKSADGADVKVTDASKIITIGGSITEVVYALESGSSVIATDISSTYPSEIFSLPRVPYIRNLTSEGILSLGAKLILSSDEAQPATAIQQLREAGSSVLLVKDEESLEGVVHKIQTIASVLGKEAEGERLIKENRLKYMKADSIRATLTSRPKVLFVLAQRSGNELTVAGDKTGAKAIIELAGGINAINSFEGYKPASIESIIAADPDYILFMQGRGHTIQSNLKKTVGINLTTAIKKDQVIHMDGNYLLGFGPRFGTALLDLMSRLHPEVNVDF